MKKIVFVISLLIGNFMFGQKAKYEFKVESNHSIVFQRLSEDGNYIVGTKKNPIVLKKQDIRIISLDENLKVKFENNMILPNVRTENS